MSKSGVHTIAFFYLALFHVQSYKKKMEFANFWSIFIVFFYVNMSKNIFFAIIERFCLEILKKSRTFVAYFKSYYATHINHNHFGVFIVHIGVRSECQAGGRPVQQPSVHRGACIVRIVAAQATYQPVVPIPRCALRSGGWRFGNSRNIVYQGRDEVSA